MDDITPPALHGLIQRLPFALALFDQPSGAGFANDRFAEVFLPGQLDSPDVQRLAHNQSGGWQAVNLRRCDGRDVETYVQAVHVADGVLLAFDEAGSNWMKENTRLRQRIAELESLSATDRLTGAWNRVQLERMVDTEISRAKRSGQPVTLILLDIDHFKSVNDVYGHLTGDAVLREFVGRIREHMRNIDSLFRWGGDEFVVLAPSIGYQGGAVLAERLRTTIAPAPFAKVGTLTASLGVTEHLDGESADSWFLRTDQALYAAKSAGRNRVHIERQGSSDLVAHRAGIEVLQLNWQEAYECGEPTIDAQHRELFDLGNALIAVAIGQHAESGLWRTAFESMLAHLALHFGDEEAVLDKHGYARFAEHQHAHTVLLSRADELKVAVEGGDATLGDLVNFLVNDVIVLHLLKIDTDFYPLLRRENRGSADSARSSRVAPASDRLLLSCSHDRSG